jgi:hypothetical protein
MRRFGVGTLIAGERRVPTGCDRARERRRAQRAANRCGDSLLERDEMSFRILKRAWLAVIPAIAIGVLFVPRSAAQASGTAEKPRVTARDFDDICFGPNCFSADRRDRDRDCFDRDGLRDRRDCDRDRRDRDRRDRDDRDRRDRDRRDRDIFRD